MARKRYPQEFRDRVVELSQSGRSVSSLAEEFKLRPQTIRIWIDRANEPEESDVSKEIRRVRRELAKVTEERDILRKAAEWATKKDLTKNPN